VCPPTQDNNWSIILSGAPAYDVAANIQAGALEYSKKKIKKEFEGSKRASKLYFFI
tara:strand:- start:531 stop:698 length:168 start_codon:yes stop_codon:yes gene_type:complete